MASGRSPAEPRYRCTVCGADWAYAQVRHAGRCRHCGAGLTRVVPDGPALLRARTPARRSVRHAHNRVGGVPGG
jgi:hypothetical protein